MATSSPVSSYMLNYFSALEALELVQAKLRHKARDFLSPEQDRAEAAAAYVDCTAQIERLESAHQAFMIRFLNPLTPPSSAVITKTRELAAGLADTISKSLIVSALIDAVTKVVSAWAELGGDPAAAGAGAGTDLQAPGNAAPPTMTSSLAWLQGHADANKKAVPPQAN